MVESGRYGEPPEAPSGPDGVAGGLPLGLGENLPPTLRMELHTLLSNAAGQLRSAYAARVAHPTATPTQLLPYTDAANVGALSNRLAVVNAVFKKQMPGGPSTAALVAGGIRRLLHGTTSDSVRTHLTEILTSLEEVGADPNAAEAEAKHLEAESTALEKTAEATLHAASGVYVYTYPHYWRHPYIPGTQFRLLKVGQTNNGAWQRIRSQARTTGTPENPLLLRVYVSNNAAATERIFHRLMDAAEHQRSEGYAVGREWFATTLNFCDEIARTLGLEILSAGIDG